MKTFTATIEPKPYDPKTDTTYIDNSYGDSMCKKYNVAIDMVQKEGYKGWVCFIHDDACIETPQDIVAARLDQAYEKGQRIALQSLPFWSQSYEYCQVASLSCLPLW